MSHFTVLIIGDDIDEQLAPFEEYDGGSKEYAEWVEAEDEDEEGYWSNPNSKWDWYVLGGRWSGFFTLKNGLSVNQAKKGDIDFEGMILEKSKKLGEYWESVHKHIPKDIHFQDNFDELVTTHGFKDGKTLFWEQPFIKAVEKSYKENDDMFWVTWKEIRDLDCPREEYIEKNKYGCVTTYAYIKDSKWYSNGDMGWWGISHNEILDSDKWERSFYDKLISLPDDTLISVVDCHV